MVMGTDIKLADIEQAAKRIAPHIRTTPVFHANRLAYEIINGDNLFFKLETLQVTGSFKVRGALNKMLQFSQKELAHGMVAASGGNHGKAIAYAARLIGVPAEIFITFSTPEEKAENMRAYDARVHRAGRVLDDSGEEAARYATEKQALLVHGFSDPDVIAGNGTLGTEILAQLPDVDTVLIACGGGGMLAGVSTAIKSLNKDVNIIGIEPTGAATLHSCLKAGHVTRLETVDTKAGTLALATTSELNFKLIKANCDEILLVSDEEMITAAQWLWDRFKIAAEMSASAGVAALLTQKYQPKKGEKVCVILCGAGDDGV